MGVATGGKLQAPTKQITGIMTAIQKAGITGLLLTTAVLPPVLWCAGEDFCLVFLFFCFLAIWITGILLKRERIIAFEGAARIMIQ